MRFFAVAKNQKPKIMPYAAIIAALAQLGMGVYNSIKSANQMNQYRDLMKSRMALNDAKIAEAGSTSLTPTGQAYLTAAEEKLKGQTDSLKGITAVNGGGLDTAKAKSVYGSTLGGLVSDLYSKDYALKQQRLNALEGYGNSLYNNYLNSISQQSGENAKAASQLYSGAVSTAVGAFDNGTTRTGAKMVDGLTPKGTPDSITISDKLKSLTSGSGLKGSSTDWAAWEASMLNK